MSKTSQRKRAYFNKGANDFKEFRAQFPPYWPESHPFNTAYMEGWRSQEFIESDKKYSINNSILQRFREIFAMESLHG